ISRILGTIHLPLISGCIFTGIIAGPYVSGFLSINMVDQFSLIDDLALSFIALTAGGELRLLSLKKRSRAIILNIILQTVIVFCLVSLFVAFAGSCFGLAGSLSFAQTIVLSILLGVVAVARSPSSAIAIISECRAAGPFTDTVLGVTVVLDVLIIIFFTFALAASKIILTGSGVINIHVLMALSLEMMASFLIGTVLGKGIAFYIKRVGHDLPLFLLFIAFAVSKMSIWIGNFMDVHYSISLHLEPLLICMSAGFVVQNFSDSGSFFMESLDRIALPIYVLFFSLAGAALNLESLLQCWPLALFIVVIRSLGIFSASYAAGKFSRDPPTHYKHAWMAYLTQAGVAIGLAQLANRQFPEIGDYLMTIVLAVITVNQVVGPITFKIALGRVGEVGKR
ncbi:cation:proton antiporter, partial [candidate division CSSED10-310 bacterium]